MEKRNVLFIDDDVIVLNSLERGLVDESYKKFFANTCEQAQEILQREEIHVIVTDMCMPEMTGLEFLRKARKEHPDIIVELSVERNILNIIKDVDMWKFVNGR